MKEHEIIENGIVPIYRNEKDERIVDGRELWIALENKRQFADWVKERLSECDAIENTDFSTFSQINEKGGRPTIEYAITLSIAKEMAMLERNEKGKEVRKYFISIEEKYNQQQLDIARLSPQMQLLMQMATTMAQQELKVNQLEAQTADVKRQLDVVQDTIIQRDDDWRKSITSLINKAVEATETKDHKAFRQMTYDILDERAHCRVNDRLRNLHERLYQAGATKTKIKETTRLDVIESDPKLKEIYTSIIKELSIKYSLVAQAQ